VVLTVEGIGFVNPYYKITADGIYPVKQNIGDCKSIIDCLTHTSVI
jgi:hypothetical protein